MNHPLKQPHIRSMQFCNWGIKKTLRSLEGLCDTLSDINPFHATGLFLNPVKISENEKFPNDFWGDRKKTVAWHGLTNCSFLQFASLLSLLIHFIAVVSFHTPHLFCFQGVQKETSGMKWVKNWSTKLVMDALFKTWYDRFRSWKIWYFQKNTQKCSLHQNTKILHHKNIL